MTAPPISIERRVLVALEERVKSLGHFEEVTLFEASPFAAVDQGHLERGSAACVVGMDQDASGIRSGAGTRASTRMAISVVVLVSLQGRDGLRANTLLLADLGAAVASDLESWSATGLRTATGLTSEIMSLSVGDVEVLADEDGNFGGREVPLTITLNRIS